MGGIALPGTTRDGFLKCGTIQATLRCSLGILVRSGPMPFSPGPMMATGATFGLEVAQADQFFGSQVLPYSELRSAGGGRRLRSFGGRRRGVVRRFLILGRGDNGGGSQAGPGDRARTTNAMANVRLPRRIIGPRSMKGTRNSVSTAIPGKTTLPTDFQRPFEELEQFGTGTGNTIPDGECRRCPWGRPNVPAGPWPRRP